MISDPVRDWCDTHGVRLVDGDKFWRFQLASMPDNVASMFEGKNEFWTQGAAYMQLGRVLLTLGEIS